MTISSTTNRVSYTGNGATTAFPFPYYFLADADLAVVETVIATGVETVKTITSEYTVSGAGDANGGTVMMLTAPASTVRLTIYRDPALTQTVDLVENDPLPVNDAVEKPLDKLTMIAQRLKDRLDRVLQQPEGDAANISRLPAKVARANKYMAFDANGEPAATVGTSDLTVHNSFMQTLHAAADAAAARTTLGALATAGDTMTGALVMSGAAINEAHGADITSAGTINLTTATGNLVDVTGTTTITAITLAEGAERTVRFTGALTLTNGASLVLPGAANITTAAGDFAVFRGYAAGVVRCVTYQKLTGLPTVNPNKLLQYASSLLATSTTTTSVIPHDDTIPQSGEGAEFTTLAFTPVSASSTLKITVQLYGATGASPQILIAALFKDAGADALAAGSAFASAMQFIVFTYYEASGSTSARTYKLRYGPGQSDTARINGNQSNRLYGGIVKSGIIVEEFA